MEARYKLYHGDCLEVMKSIQDKSVDMILCDLPYQTTSCKWDKMLDNEKMWAEYERIIKDDGAIVLFGQEPFSSRLRLSNIKLYKYDYKWIKSKVGNFLNCKNSPLKKYEDVMVFSKGTIANGSDKLMKYYPQGLVEINKKCNNKGKSRKGTTIEERPSRQGEYIQQYTNYPNNLLVFNSEYGLHATQKPVSLLEFLIKTYTKDGNNEVVLDNCMGSGSAGVACLKLGDRKFIGIELDDTYFEIAKNRMEETEKALKTKF